MKEAVSAGRSVRANWDVAVSVCLFVLTLMLGGLIATVLRIARRQTSWPIAVGVFLLCLLTALAGVVWFTSAVGV